MTKGSKSGGGTEPRSDFAVFDPWFGAFWAMAAGKARLPVGPAPTATPDDDRQAADASEKAFDNLPI